MKNTLAPIVRDYGAAVLIGATAGLLFPEKPTPSEPVIGASGTLIASNTFGRMSASRFSYHHFSQERFTSEALVTNYNESTFTYQTTTIRGEWYTNAVAGAQFGNYALQFECNPDLSIQVNSVLGTNWYPWQGSNHIAIREATIFLETSYPGLFRRERISIIPLGVVGVEKPQK